MPKATDYFAGKTIIITGAASGIGRAAPEIAAREKAKWFARTSMRTVSRKRPGAINAIGSQALALTIDVTRRAAVEDTRRACDRRIRECAISVPNSAGAAIRRAKFEIDDDLLDRTFDLNVKGTLYPMQAVLPHACEQIRRDRQYEEAHGASARRSSALLCITRQPRGPLLTMTMGVAREFAT